MNPVRYRIYKTTLLLLTVLSVAAGAAANVTVYISGANRSINSFDDNETTFFSFSELADAIGGELDWGIIGHQVVYSEDNNRFVFIIGSPYFKRNDSLFNMTFPARYERGLLYLPATTFLHFLDQVTNQKISWDDDGKSIRVESEYFNVTDMSVSAKANGLLIEIYMTTSLAYDVFVTEGNWVNVSFRDGRINVPRIESRNDSRYMYSVKTHQEGSTGQISFRLKRKIDKWHYKTQNDPPRIQISIEDTGFELATEDTSPHIGPDDKVDVIVIDPGHGGAHYGAIGPGGTREKDVALDIAKELAKLIRKDKLLKVILTRDRDETVTLQQRADIANNASCDLFVSIHANSSLKRSVRGWNVFFLAQAKNDSARSVAQFENSAFFRDQVEAVGDPDKEPDIGFDDPVLNILNEMIMTEFQSESQDFAMMVEREMRRDTQIPSRGVDQAGFYVLNMVFAPSILVETGFISNPDEERLLRDRKFQRTTAEAIYAAIKRFKAKYESN